MGYREGANLVLDFKYPFQHFNRIKNHWHQSDPVTALFDAQPGMIASDSDDEKLYHFTGQSPGFDEILQENYSFDKIPRFLGVDLWSNAYHHIIRASEAEGLAGADLRIGLDETLRSMVICDREDIGVDFGLAAETDPSLTIFSADMSLNAKFGRHTILPSENDAATPTLAFGDGDTGFYEYSDDRFHFATAGSWRFELRSTYFKAANGGAILNALSSATVPSLVPNECDDDTGIGRGAADQLSLIAGGAEGIRITEDTTIAIDLNGEVNSVSHYGTMQTATGDGTTTVDWGLGNIMYFTFGAANETFTFTAPANKGKVTLILKQDGVGSRTATWPGTVDWPGAVAPTLTTAAAAVDIVTFIYDGTNWLGLFNGDFR